MTFPFVRYAFCQSCLRFELAEKKQSRADFPSTNVWFSYKIFQNSFTEREIGSAAFFARPTQAWTALDMHWHDIDIDLSHIE